MCNEPGLATRPTASSMHTLSTFCRKSSICTKKESRSKHAYCYQYSTPQHHLQAPARQPVGLGLTTASSLARGGTRRQIRSRCSADRSNSAHVGGTHGSRQTRRAAARRHWPRRPAGRTRRASSCGTWRARLRPVLCRRPADDTAARRPASPRWPARLGAGEDSLPHPRRHRPASWRIGARLPCGRSRAQCSSPRMPRSTAAPAPRTAAARTCSPGLQRARCRRPPSAVRRGSEALARCTTHHCDSEPAARLYASGQLTVDSSITIVERGETAHACSCVRKSQLVSESGWFHQDMTPMQR